MLVFFKIHLILTCIRTNYVLVKDTFFSSLYLACTNNKCSSLKHGTEFVDKHITEFVGILNNFKYYKIIMKDFERTRSPQILKLSQNDHFSGKRACAVIELYMS